MTGKASVAEGASEFEGIGEFKTKQNNYSRYLKSSSLYFCFSRMTLVPKSVLVFTDFNCLCCVLIRKTSQRISLPSTLCLDQAYI